MANTAERMKRLEEKRAQLNAEILKIRAVENKQVRKDEDRRKILVGAMLLKLVEDGEWPKDKLRARLDSYLVRDRDRALFDLPLLDEADRARRDAGVTDEPDGTAREHT